jgi:hypothetical protein
MGSAATLAARPATRVVSPAPRDAWQALHRSDPDALPTQSPEWLDCVCALTDARDASRLYDFGDGRRMVLPLVRRGRGPLATEASYPPAWGFGGLVGAEPTVEEVRAVLGELRSSKSMSVRVRPNPLHAETWAAAAPDAITRIERRAHVIDLSGGFDQVWKHGFSKNARTDVRRAERSGVRVEADDEGRLLHVYYDMFMRSVERWAARQHEPLALARLRARRRDSIEKLRRIMCDLGETSRLWVAWVGEQPAAATLVLRSGNAHDTRGVMDIDVAGPTRANYLLHRYAIQEACERGCLSYHMGESGSSRSLSRFKEAFGARPHEYAEYIAAPAPVIGLDRGARTVAKRILRFRDDG